MRSLRSDTLTMRVTGVRITVFCSAIVIDVIVHCHAAGAFFESNGRKQLSLSSCGWVLILSGQFKITIGLCPFSPLPVSSCSILTSTIKALRGTYRRITVQCFLRGSKPALPVTRLCTPSECYQCGQTLNNDGLLSVWFNDEDCLAYVRDAYFLNR